MEPLTAEEAWQVAGMLVLKVQLSSLLARVRQVYGMAGAVCPHCKKKS